MQSVLEIIGNVVIGIGAVFMLIGVLGLFRFKDFYPRLLISSKIDTVGLLTLLCGVALRHGLTFFTGKVLLIVIIILILNPLVAHIVAVSAYEAGYELEGTLSDEIENKGTEENNRQEDK